MITDVCRGSARESGTTACLPGQKQVISNGPPSRLWACGHHMFMEVGTLGPASCYVMEEGP